MASHLDTPLQETQRKTTSTEFNTWLAFLELKEQEEFDHHSKLEHYLGSIWMEIRMLRQENAKLDDPPTLLLSEFLIPKQKKPEKKLTMADVQRAKANMQARTKGLPDHVHGQAKRNPRPKPKRTDRDSEKEEGRPR